jgi:Flp pilus assembly protein CpaB
VTLKNSPLSYHAWTQEPLVDWPAANIPRGVLKTFDLPDLIQSLDSKIFLIQPWGATMRPLTGSALSKALQQTGLSKTLIKRG